MRDLGFQYRDSKLGKLSALYKMKAAIKTIDLDTIVKWLRVFVVVIQAMCMDVRLHNLILNYLMP